MGDLGRFSVSSNRKHAYYLDTSAETPVGPHPEGGQKRKAWVDSWLGTIPLMQHLTETGYPGGISRGKTTGEATETGA